VGGAFVAANTGGGAAFVAVDTVGGAAVGLTRNNRVVRVNPTSEPPRCFFWGGFFSSIAVSVPNGQNYPRVQRAVLYTYMYVCTYMYIYVYTYRVEG